MVGTQNSLPRPSLTFVPSMTMNRMTKKAASGGPSSDDAFPLKEKTKFQVLLLAVASYLAYFLSVRLIPLLEPCTFVWWYDIYDRSSVALAFVARLCLAPYRSSSLKPSFPWLVQRAVARASDVQASKINHRSYSTSELGAKRLGPGSGTWLHHGNICERIWEKG